MEKQYKTNIISHHVLLITIIIISFSIASFAFCIISEFNKSKKKEVRVDGDLCYLPQSKAFGYGIAALICSAIAQIVGTGFFVFCKSRSTDSKSLKTSFATILLFLSWASFLIMVILTGTATTMNQKQVYGDGWVDDKCYLVKNGVYVGSGILVLITTSSTLLSFYLVLNRSEAIHAQVK